MRRIINSTFVSLDGVMKNPQDWPSLDGDDTGSQTRLLLGCDAVLLGRHTYDSFASVWQGRSGDPYTDQINSMTKYVVSSTLDEAKWNNTTVIAGDAVAEIARLKAEPGKDILQYGFGRLSHTLMAHGLLDELRLWVHPFFIGSDGADGLLFREGSRSTFDLVDTTTFKSGVVLLSYQLKPTAAGS